MNLYAIIILATLLLNYLLTLVADLLNLRALAPNPPPGFEAVYDPETYRRSQSYTRAATRFGFVTSTFDLVVLLVFWFAGGFQHLDAWLRSFELGSIPTGLLFIGILSLGSSLLSLPFSLYSTFVLEERFGFNRTTPRTFVLDLLKGLGLAVLVGVPVLTLLLTFFERAGDAAWLLGWLTMTAISLLFLFIFPVWILPLFYRFEPLEDGKLRTALESYAQRIGFRLSGIFVIDGSRRSSRTNAFFTGFGRTKRIALFDTLIEQHTVPELVAVLAHEVGHYKKKHLVQGLILSILHNGVLFYLLSLFLGHRGLFDAFFMESMAVYSGLVFFGLLYSPIELLLALIMNWQTRRHEFEADRFAAETSPEPTALASALQKMAADNLSNLTPHPFYVFLNYSHPPIPQRVAAIRNLAS